MRTACPLIFNFSAVGDISYGPKRKKNETSCWKYCSCRKSCHTKSNWILQTESECWIRTLTSLFFPTDFFKQETIQFACWVTSLLYIHFLSVWMDSFSCFWWTHLVFLSPVYYATSLILFVVHWGRNQDYNLCKQIPFLSVVRHYCTFCTNTRLEMWDLGSVKLPCLKNNQAFSNSVTSFIFQP